jgi:hypothetical protein
MSANLKDSILLAGAGRSGTTWISNILNYDNEYRDIFEPFSNIYTKECHAFAYKQYLRENDTREYFTKTARTILTGGIDNKWVNQYNRKFFCKKKLIKDIRINFILKWIRKQFPEVNIVFVIRHPIAVAHSRLKLGWKTHLELILEQEELVNDFLLDKLALINTLTSSFERQIYLWCIENYVPLKTLTKDDACIVSYEQFCLQPEQESKRLLHCVGKKYDERVRKVIQKPSKVSEKHSAINTGDNLINTWQKDISGEECKKAIKILSFFGFDEYYNENPLPLKVLNFPD